VAGIIAGAEGAWVNPHRHPLFLWIVALLAMTAFARLGFWQLERAGQKREMLGESTAALTSRVPQPLSVIADRARAGDYDWVEVEGRFADAPVVWLDNQQRNGAVGVRAYRVFVLQDGLPLLVDLGWAALPPDRTLPKVQGDSQRAMLAGLLMPPPGQGLNVGGPVAQSDGTLLATAIDLPTLRSVLELPALAPRVLRPEHDDVLGFARDFDVLPNTLPPERHLGYAVQWFALAATVLITALLLTWRMRRAVQRNDRPSR
jgi:surfeit locus 1 family protein